MRRQRASTARGRERETGLYFSGRSVVEGKRAEDGDTKGRKSGDVINSTRFARLNYPSPRLQTLGHASVRFHSSSRLSSRHPTLFFFSLSPTRHRRSFRRRQSGILIEEASPVMEKKGKFNDRVLVTPFLKASSLSLLLLSPLFRVSSFIPVIPRSSNDYSRLSISRVSLNDSRLICRTLRVIFVRVFFVGFRDKNSKSWNRREGRREEQTEKSSQVLPEEDHPSLSSISITRCLQLAVPRRGRKMRKICFQERNIHSQTRVS